MLTKILDVAEAIVVGVAIVGGSVLILGAVATCVGPHGASFLMGGLCAMGLIGLWKVGRFILD